MINRCPKPIRTPTVSSTKLPHTFSNTPTILSIIFVYYIELTKPEYIGFKGTGFGLLLWIFVLGMVGTLRIATLPAKTPLTVLVMFFTHAFFGLVIGFILKKYGKAAFNGKY